MHLGRSHFSILVAIFLAVLVQLCCCTTYSWTSALGLGDLVGSVESAGRVLTTASGSHSCHQSSAKTNAAANGAPDDPASPCDGPDSQDCGCGINSMGLPSGERTMLEPPSEVVLAASLKCMLQRGQFKPRLYVTIENLALMRRSRTLLSLHCSLIV
jgi:hypothetical protein